MNRWDEPIEFLGHFWDDDLKREVIRDEVLSNKEIIANRGMRRTDHMVESLCEVILELIEKVERLEKK